MSKKEFRDENRDRKRRTEKVEQYLKERKKKQNYDETKKNA